MTHLVQFYWDKTWDGDKEASDFRVAAWSTGMQTNEASSWQGLANLGSSQRKDLGKLTHGYSLQEAKGSYLLIHSRPGEKILRGYVYPTYRYLIIPSTVIHNLSGNLQPLFALLDKQPHPEIFQRGGKELPSIELRDIHALTRDHEIAALEMLYKTLTNSDSIMQLLTALITGKGVALVEAPTDPTWRWNFCQAIMLILPAMFRYTVTFATEVFESDNCSAQLKFLYDDPNVKRSSTDLTFSLKKQQITSIPLSPHPYAQWLAAYWTKGAFWLVEMLCSEVVTETLTQQTNKPMADALTALADELVLQQKVDVGSITTADLPQLERWLREKLNLTPLYPDLTKRLQNNLQKLTQLGFGLTMYNVLETWLKQAPQPQAWYPTLAEIALATMRLGQSEPQILQFVQRLNNTTHYFPPSFWTDCLALLQPMYPKSADLSLVWLNLTLDYKPLPDNWWQLGRTWPTALQNVINALEQPQRKVPPKTLLTAYQSISVKHQPAFWWQLLRLVQQQRSLTLIDQSVITELTRLVQTQTDQVRVVVRWLDEQRGNLESTLLLELAALHVTLKELEAARLIWRKVHQEKILIPSLVQQLQHVCQNYTQPAPLWATLKQESFTSRVMESIYLGLLNNPQSLALHHEIYQRAMSQVWAYTGWFERAELLNRLAQTPIRTKMLIELYQYAYQAPAEELKEMNQYTKPHQGLSQEAAYIEVFAMLSQALGSQDLTKVEPQLNQVVRFLGQLQQSKIDWARCEPEIMKQLREFNAPQLAKFHQSCLELAAILEPSSFPLRSTAGQRITPETTFTALQKVTKAMRKETLVTPSHFQSSSPTDHEQSTAFDPFIPLILSLIALVVIMLIGFGSPFLAEKLGFIITASFSDFSATITLLALVALIGKSLWSLIFHSDDWVNALLQIGLALFLIVFSILGWLLASQSLPWLISGLGLAGLLYVVVKPFLPIPHKQSSGLDVAAMFGLGLLFTCSLGTVAVVNVTASVSSTATPGVTSPTTPETPKITIADKPTVTVTPTSYSPEPLVIPTDTPIPPPTPTFTPSSTPIPKTESTITPPANSLSNLPVESVPSQITLAAYTVIYTETNATLPFLTIERNISVTATESVSGWQKVEFEGWVYQKDGDILTEEIMETKKIRIIKSVLLTQDPDNIQIGNIMPGNEFPKKAETDEARCNMFVKCYQIQITGYITK